MRMRCARWGVCLAMLCCGAAGAGTLGTGGVCDDFQFYGSDEQQSLLGDGGTGDRIIYVQAFEPPQYPWVYDELCVELYLPTPDYTLDLDLVVYDTLGPDGAPGNLLSLDAVSGEHYDAFGFAYRRFSITPQVLAEGLRYFGVAWDSGLFPDIGMPFDINSNGTPPDLYYSRDDGETWRGEGLGSNFFALHLRMKGEPFCERTLYGKIAAGMPTWNRISAAASSLECNAPAVDVPQDGQSYKAFPIVSDTGGPLVAIAGPVVGGGDIGDTVMAVYCDPFDPANPTANLIAYDDNAGEGNYPAFTANDGLGLAAGETYWLVISTQTAGDTGDFKICLANGYRRIDPCAQAFDGTLLPIAPQFDRPASAVAFDPGEPCQAAAAPGGNTLAPFAVYEVVAEAATPFTASIAPLPGGVAQPSLYLYCGFDRTQPAANVVEGDTSSVEDATARIGDGGPVILTPGVPYQLLVSAFDAGAANFGAYRLCVAEGFAVAEAPPPGCGDGAAFALPPAAPYDDWDHSGSGAGVIGMRFDSFFDAGSVGSVTWYATHNTPGGDACTRTAAHWRLRLYADDNGAPGALVHDETFTTPPVDAGYAYDLDGAPLALWRYDATLAAPVALSDGWINLGGVGESDCPTYWMHSPVGNGSSVFRLGGDSTNPYDLAFCIYPGGAAPHTADQNGDNQINLSELLRVIQFYNSTGYGCEPGAEDGFAPDDPDRGCTAHASDYSPQDWGISLSELLRLIQFYNSGGYHPCAEGEDGFCPGD